VRTGPAPVRLGVALSNEIPVTAATLDEASGGRLRLGIGAALWTLRALGEDDPRTRRPLAAMTEAVAIIRAMVSDGAAPDPAIFTARSSTQLDFVPHRSHLPIYVGAVNARMLEASGALADGVQLGAITSPGYARADAAAARDATRQVLAYYLHRVEGVVVDTSGADPGQVAAVRRAVLEDGVAAGARKVTDHLIDVFAAAGDPDHVTARLREYTAAGCRGLELLARNVAPKL
jgi:5,10-methylenetetrahydromethanopterin reductase